MYMMHISTKGTMEPPPYWHSHCCCCKPPNYLRINILLVLSPNSSECELCLVAIARRRSKSSHFAVANHCLEISQHNCQLYSYYCYNVFMSVTIHSIVIKCHETPKKLLKNLIQQDCSNNIPTYNHDDTCKQSMHTHAYTYTPYFPAIATMKLFTEHIPTKIPKRGNNLSTSANNIQNNKFTKGNYLSKQMPNYMFCVLLPQTPSGGLLVQR